MNWRENGLIRINTIEAWHHLLAQSSKQPFLLFKYSMTCFSSITANKELRKLKTNLPIYTVIVQTERTVSNLIESDLDVKHESPQLLIIKNKKAVWQATHYHIKRKLVDEAVQLYG